MRALFIVVFLVLANLPGRAQIDTRAILPLERSLEQALNRHDYEQFGRILSTTSELDALRAASWMRDRVLAGDGAFMMRAYASTLWRATAGAKAPSIRETVAVMTVYLDSVIVLDGLKCADKSAAPERLQQVTAELRPVLDYMRTLPSERRAFVLETAFRIEEKLADTRADDDWICRAGLQAMMSALKNGTPAQAMPAPGSVGKTVRAQPDPDFTPAFRNREDWEPEQKARRPELRAAIRASLLENAQ